MISFEEFKEIIREKVTDKVNGEVTVVKVPKNNGVKLDGLSVKIKTSNMSPLIYLSGYYNDYSNGRSIESIVDSIISICKRESGIKDEVIRNFTDFSIMKDYIQSKLVNKESNIELLKNVPHRKFLDLAIVYMANIPFGDEHGEGTVLINRNHMEMWGINEEEMFNIAKFNNINKNPEVIKSMNDVIKDMYINEVLGAQEEDELCAMIDSEENYLYVLTNICKHSGAITITYENVLRNFANEKNCNLFILPSSIHEVLLVPEEDNIEVAQLKEMVQSVNQTELDEMELLSNNVYYYDRKTDKITIA